jgi:hypothetical protein
MVPAERASGNRPRPLEGRTESERAAYHSRMGNRFVGSLRLLLALAVAGCAGPPATPSASQTDAPASPSAPSPTGTVAADGAAADLDALVSTLDRVHPDAWHGIAREDFVAALDAYEAALPGHTAEESVVELMRVTALLSRAGRDGHQFALPQPGCQAPVLPLTVYEFDEGVTITAAAPPHEGLVGATITAIDGSPIDEVLAAVEPLVPRDGPATVPAFRPIFLPRTEVLRGLGIIGDGPVEVAYDHHGFESSEAIDPIAWGAYQDWLGDRGMQQLPASDRSMYLANPEPMTTRLLDDGVLYIRYRSVQTPSTSDASELIEAGSVRRLVLDLRQNPGGDNTTYGTLLDLVQDFAEAHPGQLRVLVDRVTFSAAANLATDIERRTDAVFVGEPMGGGLNFWDDVTQVRLDSLPVPMQVGVSTRYWQFADPDDPRLTIEPDIAVRASREDFLGGGDPVLDAAIGE